MIKRGFNKLIAKRMEWPPSAPEFAGLCNLSADDFNFPRQEDASAKISDYMRERKYNQPPVIRLTPFEYTLYCRISKIAYELFRMDSKSFKKEFGSYYQEIVDHAVNGGELLEQPELLEVKEKECKPASKEKVQQYIKNMRDILGASSDESTTQNSEEE